MSFVRLNQNLLLCKCITRLGNSVIISWSVLAVHFRGHVIVIQKVYLQVVIDTMDD